MTALPTTPRSNFRGQHHRQFQLPLAGQVEMQFHNVRPGEFWHGPDAFRLLSPFTLPADPVRPRWNVDVDNFLVIYNQRTDRMWIQCFHRPENSPVFFLALPWGVYTPGLNSLQDPPGVFSFGGTVTMKWGGLPL